MDKAKVIKNIQEALELLQNDNLLFDDLKEIETLLINSSNEITHALWHGWNDEPPIID